MAKKILIIGGVAAGPKAACRLKRLLGDAEVTIVDQDSLISYGMLPMRRSYALPVFIWCGMFPFLRPQKGLR